MRLKLATMRANERANHAMYVGFFSLLAVLPEINSSIG